PMLDVLFGQTKPVTVRPNLDQIGNFKDYIFNYLNYWTTQYAGDDKMKALVLVIGLVISLFLLKNLFNYLAMYFITFLRNWVLKDYRHRLYKRIVHLSVSYYT